MDWNVVSHPLDKVAR